MIQTDPDSYGRWLIHVLAAEGDADQMQKLLDSGADPNKEMTNGETPLHWASTAEIVTLLVDRGADMDRLGAARQGVLSSACLRMRPSAVRQLIAYGADVNEVDALFGSTPLIWAAGSLANELDPTRGDKERVAIIQTLRAAGATIDHQNLAGDTALIIAKRYESETLIDALSR